MAWYPRHQAFGWNLAITLLSYFTGSVKGIRLPFPRKMINGFTRCSPSANSVIWTVHWRLSSLEPPPRTHRPLTSVSVGLSIWKAVGFGPCWLLVVGSIGPKVQPHPHLLFGGCHDEIAEQPNAYPLALSGRCWWLASCLFGCISWSPKTIHREIGSWYLAPARWELALHIDETTILSPPIPSFKALCTPWTTSLPSLGTALSCWSSLTCFLCCSSSSFTQRITDSEFIKNLLHVL